MDRGASLPDYAYFRDAGLDLYSNKDILIKVSERGIISTGVALEIPKGYVGLIWDRSSLGIKEILKTLGGVIDSGYRGEIKVGVVNLSKKDFKILRGQKIDQMIIQKKESIVIEEVDNLSESERSKKASVVVMKDRYYFEDDRWYL
ncbi:MAG: dUTP diphosphatase [Patescibacteria group bacterium]|nr:dUTP diphosphatase [Patescibacteria group bacterium]